MVLFMRLNGNFVEYKTDEFSFGETKIPVRDAVDAIDLAAHDARVKGIVAQWDGGIGDMAQLEELRNAIMRFRSSGKFSVFYAEDLAGGMGAYYLASAFNQIWMQPVGTLSIPGLRAEMPYGRDLLDKVGVTPDFFARGQYKNLFESFELKGMSPATRESMGALVADLGNTLEAGIATARNKNREELNRAINLGLMTDLEAKSMGYVDNLGYRDALLEGLRQKLVGDKDDDDALPFFQFADYAEAMRKNETAMTARGAYPKVALIYAVGEIAPGSKEQSSAHVAYGAGDGIAGDDLSQDIREAARDKDVKIIVLRVNSPGGSPSASETIRRAVVYAQGRGKTVYVSMGGAAASGGYWISTSANRIYASPLTMTGSIGVAGGKFVLQEMWKKLGVNWDGISVGDNAGMMSLNTPFTDSQRARMDAMFDRIYAAFIERVAQGRHITPERANQIAQGRVWTGRQGLQIGLVDRLGGLDTVLDDVAKELGQKNRFQLDVHILPEPESPFKKLGDLLAGQVGMAQFFQSHAGLVDAVAPVVRSMQGRGAVYERLEIQ
jgi:protease-4